MHRTKTTLALGILLTFATFGGCALASETISTTRPNGIIDVFGVVRSSSGGALLFHAAMAGPGGAILSNDSLGVQPAINLFDAGWRSNNTVLFVRAFTQNAVVEWFWQQGGWTGPVLLRSVH
jgi:hypothetical protein